MECKYLLPLTVVLLIYLCVGAAIFEATESSKEKESIEDMLHRYRDFIANHSCVSRESLREFIQGMLEKVRPYGGLSRAKFDDNLTHVNSRQVWDFPGAFTFSVTVITTIGYGHIYPVSPLGKIMCVVYAIGGIPITLLVLRGIGEQLNKVGLKMMSLKLCFKSQAINKVINIMCVVIAGIMVMFLIPTIVFNQVEGWDILKSLYYCFITLSTIGFGDFVAGDADQITNEDTRNIYRIMVYLWILVGLAYISLIIKSISDLFIKKAAQVEKEAKRVASTRLATLSTVPISAIAALGTAIENGTEMGPASEDKDLTHTNMFKQKGLKRLTLRGDTVSFDKDNDIHLVRITSINECETGVVMLNETMNEGRRSKERDDERKETEEEVKEEEEEEEEDEEEDGGDGCGCIKVKKRRKKGSNGNKKEKEEGEEVEEKDREEKAEEDEGEQEEENGKEEAEEEEAEEDDDEDDVEEDEEEEEENSEKERQNENANSEVVGEGEQEKETRCETGYDPEVFNNASGMKTGENTIEYIDACPEEDSSSGSDQKKVNTRL